MPQQTDDLIIIQQVLQGDTNAFGILVKRYEQYVFTIVLRMVPDRTQAEELAQDVFLKAYRMLPGFRGDAKFSTWLYTIVNTTCLSYLRNNKPPTISLEHEKLTAVAEHSHHQNPELKHEQKEQKRILEQAISQLAPTDAQIVTLYYLAEQNVEEIATVVSLSTDNVKIRLYRSRQKLKEIITKQYTDSI